MKKTNYLVVNNGNVRLLLCDILKQLTNRRSRISDQTDEVCIALVGITLIIESK